MLFGYILEVITTQSVAEQYLADIFNELQFTDIQAITKPGVNTFCRLQMMARKKLAEFQAAVDDCAGNDNRPKGLIIKGNKFIDMLAPDQQFVFCGVHYHGKTTANLATELNKPEGVIRQLLKESFNIIRKTRNDTAAIHR